MKRLVVVFLLCASPALAVGDEALVRVVSCKGPDATMEVYVPESAVNGRGASNVFLPVNAIGAYVLDLSEAEKGKHIEPVRVRLAGDRKFLVVEQFLRDYPATRIPVTGGTVDFDNRFATGAKCGPLNPG